MIVWMACYHDTNSMNEEREETTYAHFLSTFSHLKDRFDSNEPFQMKWLKSHLKIIKICFTNCTSFDYKPKAYGASYFKSSKAFVANFADLTFTFSVSFEKKDK